MSQLKINRAYAKSKIGSYPASREAMLDYIPAGVVAALASQQLAEMLDAMWSACQDAKRIAAQDAMRNGCIWDGTQMREIAP